MMNRINLSPIFFLVVGLLCLSSTLVQAEEHRYSPCPQVTIVSPEPVEFDDAEIKFLCGDERVIEYAVIPLSQAKFHAKAMLQKRGYHLEQAVIQDGQLTIHTGPQIYVEELEVIPGEYRFTIHHYNHAFGKLLTPALLNEIQGWVAFQLKTSGRACPQIQLLADAGKKKSSFTSRKPTLAY